MKKIGISALVLVLAFSLAACRNPKPAETTPTTQATRPSSQPTTVPTTAPTTLPTEPSMDTMPSGTVESIPDMTGNIGDTDDGIIDNSTANTGATGGNRRSGSRNGNGSGIGGSNGF